MDDSCWKAEGSFTNLVPLSDTVSLTVLEELLVVRDSIDAVDEARTSDELAIA